MPRYHFRITGLDGTGSGWSTSGYVVAENFDVAVTSARSASFEQLTYGRAVYGNPGKGGCQGPYHIKSIELKEVQ